jgi:hypothetical protein
MSNCETLIVIGISICASLLMSTAILSYRSNRLRKLRAHQLEQRVHELTLELKKYVDAERRSQAEKSLLLDRISKRINASLATMKGLGRIALTYDNVPPELVKNIDVTTDTLGEVLQQIAHEKKL